MGIPLYLRQEYSVLCIVFNEAIMAMAGRTFFAWRMFAAAAAQDERDYMSRIRKKKRAFNPVKELTETEFKKIYRISKSTFKFICEELRLLAGLKSTQRISLETKVLTALFFFATGTYQRPVGVAKGLSQKICSVYIEEVTNGLIHENMLKKYIKFPESPAARQTISQRFYAKHNIPGVIGCIDGTHIRITGPPREEEHLYFSRKQFHSINVQMICDDENRILNVNAKYGGATHDSFIWENSRANEYMQSLHQHGEMLWLLGDSGYPQRPWLMTPILDAAEGTPEAHYNEIHKQARVKIENTFGRLKNRWRCLNKDRALHYKPLKCAKIIQACCVLHNIAIDMDMDMEETLEFMELEPEEPVIRDHVFIEQSSTADLLRGRVLRAQLVRRIQHS